MTQSRVYGQALQTVLQEWLSEIALSPAKGSLHLDHTQFTAVNTHPGDLIFQTSNWNTWSDQADVFIRLKGQDKGRESLHTPQLQALAHLATWGSPVSPLVRRSGGGYL